MRTLEDVLEEIRPAPDPEFVADMERRMKLGFPRERPERRLPSLGTRPLVAVAASMVLATLVVVSLSGDDDEPAPAPTVAEVAQPDAVIDPVAPSAAGGADVDQTARRSIAPAVPPPGGGGVAPGANVRRVERSATIRLASDPAEFDDLADAIFRTAARRDGFVLQSSFTQGEDGLSSGFFELRVPAAQLQQTLNDLSGLATVRARSESGTDVTAPFISVRDRLRTAKALRTSLLNRLAAAFTDSAVDALRRRLEIVGNRISGLREQLRGMRERTEFATVMVELVDKDSGVAAGETDEAFDDAVGSLEDILSFLIRAAGILIPLAVVAGIGWLVAGRARRRARERALA